MEPEREFSSAIVATVKSAALTDLAKECAEVGLDSILSEGVLRDIPIVNTLVALTKVGLSINDRIFAKKLIRFLTAMSELDPADRISMVDRLDKEEGFRRQIGDRIIELLDRIDSQSKPEMVAKAFRAYATGKIEIDMLNRLNQAIERLPHYDVKYVGQFNTSTNEQHGSIPLSTISALVTAGLASPTSKFGSMGYEKTEVCDVFVSIELDK
jgi:hypothetical protein